MSDLVTLQARRANVQRAYDAALAAGQETQQGAGSGSRRVQRVDFDVLRKELADLDEQIARLTARRRTFYVR